MTNSFNSHCDHSVARIETLQAEKGDERFGGEELIMKTEATMLKNLEQYKNVGFFL